MTTSGGPHDDPQTHLDTDPANDPDAGDGADRPGVPDAPGDRPDDAPDDARGTGS